MHSTRFVGLVFGLMIFTLSVFSQNVLQIETRGQINALKFYEGDEVSIMLDIDKFWRHTVILEIDVENNLIDFDFGPVSLDEIIRIKTPQQLVRGRRWRRSMLMSAGSFALFTPLELIYQDDPNYVLIAGGIGIGVLGVILKPIIDLISVHRIGKRKRLRLLDISL